MRRGDNKEGMVINTLWKLCDRECNVHHILCKNLEQRWKMVYKHGKCANICVTERVMYTISWKIRTLSKDASRYVNI